MPTFTVNYNLSKPTPSGDSGSWGNQLNDDMDAIDSALKAVSDVADAALPKAGGTMTGEIHAKTESLATASLNAVSGAQNLDLNAAQYFLITPSGAITLTATNLPPAGTAKVVILQVVGGGNASFTVTNAEYPGGAAPALSIGTTIDVLAFVITDGVHLRLIGAQFGLS